MILTSQSRIMVPILLLLGILLTPFSFSLNIDDKMMIIDQHNIIRAAAANGLYGSYQWSSMNALNWDFYLEKQANIAISCSQFDGFQKGNIDDPYGVVRTQYQMLSEKDRISGTILRIFNDFNSTMTKYLATCNNDEMEDKNNCNNINQILEPTASHVGCTTKKCNSNQGILLCIYNQRTLSTLSQPTDEYHEPCSRCLPPSKYCLYGALCASKCQCFASYINKCDRSNNTDLSNWMTILKDLTSEFDVEGHFLRNSFESPEIKEAEPVYLKKGIKENKIQSSVQSLLSLMCDVISLGLGLNDPCFHNDNLDKSRICFQMRIICECQNVKNYCPTTCGRTRTTMLLWIETQITQKNEPTFCRTMKNQCYNSNVAKICNETCESVDKSIPSMIFPELIDELHICKNLRDACNESDVRNLCQKTCKKSTTIRITSFTPTKSINQIHEPSYCKLLQCISPEIIQVCPIQCGSTSSMSTITTTESSRKIYEPSYCKLLQCISPEIIQVCPIQCGLTSSMSTITTTELSRKISEPSYCVSLQCISPEIIHVCPIRCGPTSSTVTIPTTKLSTKICSTSSKLSIPTTTLSRKIWHPCHYSCGINTICINNTCECSPGHKGDPLKYCFDCRPCSTLAHCDTVNRRCICLPGNVGDGFSCVSASHCHKDAVYIKQKCHCRPGLVGDGLEYCFNCTTCNHNTECLPKESRCVCKNGYKGDGKLCAEIHPDDLTCQNLKNLCFTENVRNRCRNDFESIPEKSFSTKSITKIKKNDPEHCVAVSCYHPKAIVFCPVKCAAKFNCDKLKSMCHIGFIKSYCPTICRLVSKEKTSERIILYFGTDLIRSSFLSSTTLQYSISVAFQKNTKIKDLLLTGVKNNFWGAIQHCKSLGMRLIRIDDRETRNIVHKITSASKMFWYWVDANDVEHEGKWQHYDSSPNLYTPWRKGEPNNNGYREDCVHADGRNYGLWNDDICSKSNYVVCYRSF